MRVSKIPSVLSIAPAALLLALVVVVVTVSTIQHHHFPDATAQ